MWTGVGGSWASVCWGGNGELPCQVQAQRWRRRNREARFLRFTDMRFFFAGLASLALFLALRRFSPRAHRRPLSRSDRRPSDDDIATRAYFIAQERQARGEEGNATEDWINAERQLMQGWVS